MVKPWYIHLFILMEQGTFQAYSDFILCIKLYPQTFHSTIVTVWLICLVQVFYEEQKISPLDEIFV